MAGFVWGRGQRAGCWRDVCSNWTGRRAWEVVSWLSSGLVTRLTSGGLSFCY